MSSDDDGTHHITPQGLTGRRLVFDGVLLRRMKDIQRDRVRGYSVHPASSSDEVTYSSNKNTSSSHARHSSSNNVEYDTSLVETDTPLFDALERNLHLDTQNESDDDASEDDADGDIDAVDDAGDASDEYDAEGDTSDEDDDSAADENSASGDDDDDVANKRVRASGGLITRKLRRVLRTHMERFTTAMPELPPVNESVGNPQLMNKQSRESLYSFKIDCPCLARHQDPRQELANSATELYRDCEVLQLLGLAISREHSVLCCVSDECTTKETAQVLRLHEVVNHLTVNHPRMSKSLRAPRPRKGMPSGTKWQWFTDKWLEGHLRREYGIRDPPLSWLLLKPFPPPFPPAVELTICGFEGCIYVGKYDTVRKHLTVTHSVASRRNGHEVGVCWVQAVMIGKDKYARLASKPASPTTTLEDAPSTSGPTVDFDPLSIFTTCLLPEDSTRGPEWPKAIVALHLDGPFDDMLKELNQDRSRLTDLVAPVLPMSSKARYMKDIRHSVLSPDGQKLRLELRMGKLSTMLRAYLGEPMQWIRSHLSDEVLQRFTLG
jgi:hypothetical protein